METTTITLTAQQRQALVDCIEAAENDGLHAAIIDLAREALGIEA